MKYFFFLDVVDAGIPSNSIWAVVIVLLLTILVEAGIMFFMKYNPIKKSLLDSFLVNLASIAVGYVLVNIADNLFNTYKIVNLLLLMAITIAAELGILYLLNKKAAFKRTALVCTVMNVVTYILFYIFVIKLHLTD